jgi:hypothetical protein
MGKITLDLYIEILDRLLEREGLSTAERDAIFNDSENAELISNGFSKRVQPAIIFKKLSREPVQSMYASHLQEGKKKPTTPGGKKKKFKKVMKEFGKGKLKPYHADKTLKSKKQDGSKQEHKQALAIAFSEAGMTKESVNEARVFPERIVIDTPILFSWRVTPDLNINDFDDDFYDGTTLPNGTYEAISWTNNWVKLMDRNGDTWVVERDDLEDVVNPKSNAIRNFNMVKTNESIEANPGREYAIKFLTSLGLEHVSSPIQLKKGTLEFYDKNTDTKWQISGTGYLRKLNDYTKYLGLVARSKRQGWGYPPQAWQMVYSHFPPQHTMGETSKRFLADDEYMDMAEMISEKVRSYRKLKSK